MYIDVCKSKMNREKAAHTFLKPRLAGADSSSDFRGTSNWFLTAFIFQLKLICLSIEFHFVFQICEKIFGLAVLYWVQSIDECFTINQSWIIFDMNWLVHNIQCVRKCCSECRNMVIFLGFWSEIIGQKSIKRTVPQIFQPEFFKIRVFCDI